MTPEEEILALFDKYFENAPKSELEKDARAISKLGLTGLSFEQYIDALNKVTSFNLADTGICDDIAFSDFFNDSISMVKMGNSKFAKTIESIDLAFSLTDHISVGESNYAMAA